MRSKICTLLFLALSVAGASRAQRVADLSVQLVSPAEDAVIPFYGQYDVVVKVTNLGPDALVAGDTVYYNLPTDFVLDFRPFVLGQGIASDETVTLNLKTAINANDYEADQEMDYCVTLGSKPDHTGSFLDTANTDNNRSCHTVVFKANHGGSSIQAIDDVKSRLVLSPNPVKDRVVLKNLDWDGEVSVEILDMTGRAFHKQTFKAGPAQQPTWTMEGLPAGMYLVNIQSAYWKHTMKLCKQ